MSKLILRAILAIGLTAVLAGIAQYQTAAAADEPIDCATVCGPLRCVVPKPNTYCQETCNGIPGSDSHCDNPCNGPSCL